jgi:hypothetical protein
MSIPARRNQLYCLVTLIVISAALAGCGSTRTKEALAWPPSSFLQFPAAQPTIQATIAPTATPTVTSTIKPSSTPTIRPTPTVTILGVNYDPAIDLRAKPVELPLMLQIPALKVYAPMMGVGLTKENAMDAPKGDVEDPIWKSAFWYRGSAIPGNPGTATIAGHVNGAFGDPEIFASLKKLKPGDVIIIHVKNSLIDIRFTVDEVVRYSTQESADPKVLVRIYGYGPSIGKLPQAGSDGLAHLTLITCAGYFKDGEFDHHVVVYATRSN